MHTTMHLSCRILSSAKCIPNRRKQWMTLGCYSCRIWAICHPYSTVEWYNRSSYHSLRCGSLTLRSSWSNEGTRTNNREIIFLFLFTIFKYFFIKFSYYTYQLQKYFLFPSPVICDLTKWNRFVIYAKCLMLSLNESCRYTGDWHACPSCCLWAAKEGPAYF